VTKEDTPPFIGDFQLLRWRLVPSERGDDRVDPVLPLIIMIAKNQDLASHEPRKNASHAIAVVQAHGKIPEMIDHSSGFTTAFQARIRDSSMSRTSVNGLLQAVGDSISACEKCVSEV